MVDQKLCDNFCMLLADVHISVLGDFVYWDKGVGPNFLIKSVTLPHKNPKSVSDTFKELKEKHDMSIGHIVCDVHCVTLSNCACIGYFVNC